MSTTLDEESINQPSLGDNILQEQSLSTHELNNAEHAVSNCSFRAQVPCRLTFGAEILPLLGNPYFISIMAKSHVQLPYQLVVPTSFRDALPSATVKGVLACRGKIWEIRYCGDCTLKRFGVGWRKFVEDNELRVGDGCVFELMDDKELRFRVQILDGQIPTKIFKRGSLERPINID
ncbi:B3 domain-containing protein Os04g0386900-like [Phalaenopsis equestris]|uniref:B3 domain-containing protein Os04g0386900-like n=1 Tax=Phalaenopsis equestris TaxID=78828 RepID=UPI0009E325EA|nr:B3 domain-containing protein Os04g0386900-like [Phalaenopsis equestris]